jgi:hypothetical protein
VPIENDFSRLHLALSQLAGQAAANESGSEMACRTRRTLEALAGFIESLGVQETSDDDDGRQPPPWRRRGATPCRRWPPACASCRRTSSPGSRSRRAARARFYVIRPDDAADRVSTQSATGSDNPLAGIEHLAGATEGKLLALTDRRDTPSIVCFAKPPPTTSRPSTRTGTTGAGARSSSTSASRAKAPR